MGKFKEKQKLYLLATVGSFVGYCWFFYYNFFAQKNNSPVTVCLIKKVSGYPCPSCGTTRALSEFTKTNFITGILINPLAIFTALLLISVPVLLIYDFLFKKEILFKSYKSIEAFLQKKQVYPILILLLVLNWIWNIKKNL